MSDIDDKPYELIQTALIRANMCENLSKKSGVSAENAFTVGLFSALDAFLDQPLKTILAALPLSDELNNALLKYEGSLGRLLQLMLNYERGKWNEIDNGRYDTNFLRNSYLKSIRWAGEISDALISR